MPIESVNIETFLDYSEKYPILDVRSPTEYAHAHIPGALSLPLFTDEQREIIGTAYKQSSREAAVNHGLNYFSERMKIISDDVEKSIGQWNQEKGLLSSEKKTVLVHCWRGGMRSGAVSWLLNLYGYHIYLLKDGYKTYRNWALAQFNKNYSLKILGGYTGSGKTEVLKEMEIRGHAVIDLEGMAHHKGSTFGALGQEPQPSQEMFENVLALKLSEAQKKQQTIWVEDESRRIGRLNVPNVFWEQMRCSPLYFLEIPQEERLNFIISQYGNFSPDLLAAATLNIQKKLGGLETKNALSFLSENNIRACFEILIKYYDKLYEKGLNHRDNIEKLLKKIPCETVNIENASVGKMI